MKNWIWNIWSFNGSKFDYIFMLKDLIIKFKNLVILGNETDIK